MIKIVYVKPVKVFSIFKSTDIHEITLNELESMEDSKWKDLGRNILKSGKRLIGVFEKDDLAAVAVTDPRIQSIERMEIMPKYGEKYGDRYNEYLDKIKSKYKIKLINK